MPWQTKKPDLKNDPRYLEGKVNDVTAQLAENTKEINVFSKSVAYVGSRLSVETSDNPRIQRAIDSIAAGEVVITEGTYICNTGLTFDPTKISIIGRGKPKLDFSGLTSGYAFKTLTSSYSHESATQRIEGLFIQGPLDEATLADGFYLHIPVNEAFQQHIDQMTMQNVQIDGFRYQFVFGDNIWCFKGYNVVAGHAQKEILRYEGNKNTGENISFFGSTFYSSTNAAKNATAVHILPTAGGYVDLRFFGCSFDYNDLHFNIERGKVFIFGGYIEDRETTPTLKVRRMNADAWKAELHILGTSFYPAETVNRSAFISVEGGLSRVVANDISIEGFGKETEFIKVLGTEEPIIKARDIWYDFRKGTNTNNNGNAAHISTYLNQLMNGDFTSLSGWTEASSPNGSTSLDSNALKCAVTGVDQTHYARRRQNLPTKTGDLVYVKARYKTDGVVSDGADWKGAVIKLEFVSYDGIVIKTEIIHKSTGTSDWKNFQWYTKAPKGCFRVLFTIGVDNAIGSAWFDDVVINVL
ncbi:hypothetical protein [Planomicrobium sp. CPCC 101079]|uniref:hypothetical protein n=1 Tax=Planomicrobium sp. CPCC 101079 TaxID=2599618 RepID=UPI0011B8127E|nr:hypothetical protein [Planomicrobium sp. CPCC 101079]TWT04590.1 hypothetical protein FQV28_08280 [Planomicrobium sp. CPCC 101079]